LSAENSCDRLSYLDGQLVGVSLKVEHILLEDFLGAHPVVLAGDVRVEIPQGLSLLEHRFLHLVDFLIDFGSQFLKINSNLISEPYIASGLGGNFLDPLEESSVVRERPVPENGVFVTPFELLDRYEMLSIERLLEEAYDTLEGTLGGIRWIREQKLTLCVRVHLAKTLGFLSMLLLLLSVQLLLLS